MANILTLRSYLSVRLSALLSFCLPLLCLCNLVSFILPRMWLSFSFLASFSLSLPFHLPHLGCVRSRLCVCVNVCASHVLAFRWMMAEIWNLPLRALTPYWLRVLVTLSKGPVVDYIVNKTFVYSHTQTLFYLFIDVVIVCKCVLCCLCLV